MKTRLRSFVAVAVAVAVSGRAAAITAPHIANPRRAAAVARRMAAGGVAAFMLLAGGEASADLLPNGDFESGLAAPWSASNFSNGQLDFDGIVLFNTTGSGPSLAGRFQTGSGDAHPGGGKLFQDFAVANAGSYLVSVDVASQFAAELGYSQGDGGTFTLAIDGIALDSFVVGTLGGGQIERAHLSNTALLTAGMHEFDVGMTRSATIPASDTWLYVDNAMATDVTSPVPEPASGSLLVSGLAMLAWMGRRARRSTFGRGRPG